MVTRTAKTKVITWRLPEDILERLDRHADRMTAASPGLSFTRSDAARVVLCKGLDTLEAEASKKK